MALNSSLPQPLVPGMSVLQRKENLWSGLPLHCSCSLGWGGMSLEWGWQSSGSRTSMLKIPWSLCCCCLTGLQSHPRGANWRSTPWVAESPIYCFCPLSWVSWKLCCGAPVSKQLLDGAWGAPPPPQLPYLLPAPCSSHCRGSRGAQLGSNSLRSCPSDSPTQKSHWDGADGSEGSGLGRRSQSKGRKTDGKNENIWEKTILSELFLL